MNEQKLVVKRTKQGKLALFTEEGLLLEGQSELSIASRGGKEGDDEWGSVITVKFISHPTYGVKVIPSDYEAL